MLNCDSGWPALTDIQCPLATPRVVTRHALYLADDAAIALSLLLQLGVDPANIADRFSTRPAFVNGKPVDVFASIIGVAAKACAEMHSGVIELSGVSQ